MIVSSLSNEQGTYRSAVTLAQYSKAVEYTECALFGVDARGSAVEVVGNACVDIWTLQQRNYILRYLAEAQIELENETRMLFGRTWVTGQLDSPNDRLTDTQTYSGHNYSHYNKYAMKSGAKYTKWHNVKALGRQVVTNLALAEPLVRTGDPSTVTIALPVAPNGITDITRVRVFEAGNFGTQKQLELTPSDVVIDTVGNTLTIEIPRCRTVLYDLMNTPVSGLDYADLANFIENVDIYYFATDNVNSLSIINSNCNCGTTETFSCLEFATISDTTTVIPRRNCFPSTSCLCNQNQIYCGLYYEAGEAQLNQMQIDMIIRLAHSKMPTEPCGCETAQRLWAEDREIPEVQTADQLNCPFGLNRGAWIAWKWSQTLKKRRFGYR